MANSTIKWLQITQIWQIKMAAAPHPHGNRNKVAKVDVYFFKWLVCKVATNSQKSL